MAGAILERVLHVPEVAVDVPGFNFIVSQGGLCCRIPVDQSLAAIDQAILEQPEERFTNSPGADRVHGEPLPLPVA